VRQIQVEGASPFWRDVTSENMQALHLAASSGHSMVRERERARARARASERARERERESERDRERESERELYGEPS
jgi:hypothetical protein